MKRRRTRFPAWLSRVAPLLLAAAAGACTSTPTEVESRRVQQEDAEAEELNQLVLEGLRAAHGETAPDLVGAVEELASPDFVVATAAERSIVAAGREAFPVLVAADGFTISVLGSRVDPIAAMLREIHRRETPTHLLEDLAHENSAVRISAAEILAERDVVQAIPTLVSKLRDPDPLVGAAIAMAVSRLSRRYFGPFETRTEAEREALYRRVESWYLFPSGDGGTGPETRPERSARAERSLSTR